MTRILAIIPARAGSKRIKNKNMIDFCGKPLVAWTILTAKKAGVFASIEVSTDSQQIADVARQYGEGPRFMRHRDLAQDSSTLEDVVRDTIIKFKDVGETFQYCMVLQPTSPLRSEKDILDSIAVMEQDDIDCVISVCDVGHPIDWAGELGPDNSMDKFFPEGGYKRSQDYPSKYRLNGAIYGFSVARFLLERTFFFKSSCRAHVMDVLSSVDIDTDEDLQLATAITQLRRQES